MGALGVQNYVRPPYAATLLLELYSISDSSRDQNNADAAKQYAVAVSYKNESGHEAYPLNITG